ncbi:MAG TPA: SMP-30/gluconolactonase/LRE family protein [Thermoleophilia bacterium]|nr:SMP-30/gluconolactonase/LRE family protein [Thermoleophilia bacterium]
MRRFLTPLAVALVLVALVLATQATIAVGSPGVVSKVLVRGAPIHGANGMAINAQGRIYVGSVFGREIVIVNSRTGRIVDRLGPDDGFNGADDVTFGPDGSLYWTDILAGKVGRLESNGTMTMQDVAPFVNPITFSADGRLFVAQAFFGAGLYELDPELADPPVLRMPGSAVPPFLDQFNGFDFGPDGKLYAPHPFLGTIVRIDVDTWTEEIVADGLPFPVALKFNAKGKLYAALQNSGDVVRVFRATGKTRVVARLQPGLDNLAFDARDRMFVSHAGNGRIWRILPSGQPRRLIRGGLVAPGGIAVMRYQEPAVHDRLFVADGWEIKKYDGRNGRAEGVIRQSFTGPSIIAALTASSDGRYLILTSWLDAAVQVWDPVTSTEVGLWTDILGPLNAIRFGEDLVIADLATSSVILQTPAGLRTTLAGPLVVPTGLAAKGGDLWAADWAAGVVYQLVDDGVNLPAPVAVATGLNQPEGLAVDRDGTLLVVEAGAGRLTRIDPATGAKTLVRGRLALGAPGAPGMPPTWFFNGVAVGGRGDIYVTGDKTDVVYRIKVVPTR